MENNAEQLNHLDEEREQSEFISKNDPQKKERQAKEWGSPFDKKDDPNSKAFTKVENLADPDHPDPEAETIDNIDQNIENQKRKELARLAERILEFIKDPTFKDIKLLTDIKEKNKDNRIPDLGRWQGIDSELTMLKDQLKNSDIAMPTIEKLVSMSEEDIDAFKRKLQTVIHDAHIIERESTARSDQSIA